MTVKVKTELKERISRQPNAGGHLTPDSEYADQYVTGLVAPAEKTQQREVMPMTRNKTYTIDLLYDGDDWLVSWSEPNHPSLDPDQIVAALELSDCDDIRYMQYDKLDADAEDHALEEWRDDPETGPAGTASIDGAARIEYDDGEWRVEVRDADELQVCA